MRRALEALLRPELGPEGIAAVLNTGKAIDSGSQKAGLLAAAASLPVEGPAFAAYLDCAATIDSSAEKSRALRSLLARGGLSADQKKAITAFADREISSSSEREAVMHAAIAR